MADLDRYKNVATNAGGQDWALLVDASQDSEFHAILSNTEKNILSQSVGQPAIINSYHDQFANILAKYIGWKIYKETNVKSINKKVADLSAQIENSKSKLQTIQDTAAIISGATALVAYSKVFEDSAEKHGDNAATQQGCYFISLLGFCAIVAFTFFFSIADVPFIKSMIADDVRSLPFSTGIIALKIFLLIFAYQITQFFRKNYAAEKHLQEVYQHRSDVLQSLHAVYEALKDNSEERAKILSAGALFAYERGETGYITTKEGAGSAGDGLIESLLASVFRR